ncbi:hypothetical protein [Microcoleus sp. K4-C2]|uniref:hypothetical protein n=1 Tax=Microcoleus sp. K4-C2 TaxID=2818792 RepID=UPI002FD14553
MTSDFSLRGNDAKSRSPGCKSSIGCCICDILCYKVVGCSTKTVKQSSHCWQQNSKAEESGALSTDNISLGELTGKTHQTEFSGCNVPRGDNSLPGLIFIYFACCRLLRVEKVIWQQPSTA